MAVVSITLSEPSDGAALNDTLTDREYTDIYKVITTGVATDRWDILNDESTPIKGAAHPDDSLSRVSARRVRPGDDKQLWFLDVTYNRVLPAGHSHLAPDNPLLREPRIKWTAHTVQELIFVDVNNNNIENKAHDIFDPPVIVTRHFPKITIQRYESNFSAVDQMLYLDTVNADNTDVAGVPLKIGEGLCVKFDGENQEVNGRQYVYMTYEILVNPLGWKLKRLNMGFNRLLPVGLEKVRCIDVEGEPFVKPMKLDDNGFQKAPAGQALAADVLEFDIKKSVLWAPMGLNI